MEAATATYCSRVTQLDSLILDKEFYNFVKYRIISILDKFQLSHWVQVYEPEFDVLASTLIWRLTVGLQGCTIGQRLLGLKYPENTRRRLFYYLFNIILPYLNARIGSLLANRESPILNLDFEASKLAKKVNTFWKICQIVNLCVFLRENKYMTLSHRFSGLRIVPSKQRLPFPPGDSYQIRELLWHQFSDFLIIVVPFINLHLVKRYWSKFQKYWSASPGTQLPEIKAKVKGNEREEIVKCCFCNQDAVIPQKISNCSFCYYCLKANQIVDSNFKCEKCN